MFPTGSFDRMKNELYDRENIKGTDIPITVGILILDFCRQFCKENIFNQLERLDKRSGQLIDFYIPGYCKTKDVDEHYNESYKFKNESYSFDSYYFYDFIDQLEALELKVTGHAQLLLIPFIKGHLDIKNALSFDLEKDEKRGKIESVKLFFDFIIEIASETVAFEEFRKNTRLDRRKRTMLAFIKEKAPEAVLSFLVSACSGKV